VTQPAAQQPPTVEAPPFQVTPARNSRLAQLHAAYPDLKAKADAAAADLKACVDGIKAELSQRAPGVERVDLLGAGLPPLGLRAVTSWRLDSKALKQADPETYVRFAKQSTSWALKPLGVESED
jgi:hypothetical protein